MDRLVNQDFEWFDEAWGRALRSRALTAVARHVFTTRQLRLRGGGPMDGDWTAVAGALGVEPGRLARVHQVHGRDVAVIRRADPRPRAGLLATPPADILVTDDPHVAVSVKVADCVPLLLADSRTGAVAAAHAGWRGMAAGVPEAAVRALVGEFASDPSDLVAAAGPSIGPCCYEVGPEVRQAFAAAGHVSDRWFFAAAGGTGRARPGRTVLDLWQAAEDQLLAAGLRSHNIHVSRVCTACQSDLCWSYRRDGPGTGRMVGAIRAGQPPRP